MGNKGVVKRAQLKRVLAMTGMPLSDAEGEPLADGHCNRGNLLEVDYNQFLRVVDAPDDDLRVACAQMDGPMPQRPDPSYFDGTGTVKKSPSYFDATVTV